MKLIETQRDFIDRICERHKISYTELARKVGVAQTTITRLMDKDNIQQSVLSATTLEKINRMFSAEPFLFKTGKVPLVGYVGAGGNVNLYAETQLQELVDAPLEAVEEGAVAVKVQGNSMWPVYKDNEILYYVRGVDYDPSYIGKDCVIELNDGRTLVKILERGSANGLFNLVSYNEPPIHDVKIKWACPVKWTKKF